MRSIVKIVAAILLALMSLGQTQPPATQPGAATNPASSIKRMGEDAFAPSMAGRPAAPAPSAAPAVPPAPAPSAAPVTPPAAPVTPSAAPAVSAVASRPASMPASAQPGGRRGVMLQYDNAPIASIVRTLSDKIGKPILGDLDQVQGQVTFFDSHPYTTEEAFDTLNILLAMRGYRLAEDGRFLRLAKVGVDDQRLPTPIYNGDNMAEALKGQRDLELVTMLLPLKYLAPADAVNGVRPMVNSFGSVAPMLKSKGLVVTDTVANIRRINQWLDVMDTAETAANAQVKTVVLKNASARDVARVITELWGRGGAGGARASAGTAGSRARRRAPGRRSAQGYG